MNRPPLRALLPLLALLALTLLLTWPTAATLRSHVVDRQDPLLNAWIMAWEARQLVVDPAHLYDANIFFPQGNSLAFSETLLSVSVPVAPLQWLTGDALLAYNVAFLLGFFSTALGGYLLALHLTGRRGAALVAAVALAWSPYRLGHLSQVQLLHFGWLPLALLYLDRLLAGRGRGGRNAFLLWFFLLLQALASFYAALFSAAACLLYGAGWLLWKRSLPWAGLWRAAIAALGVAALLIPLSLPYFEVQRTLGAGWTLAQNEQFSASLQAYAYAPQGTLLWGPLTRSLHYTYGPCCPPDTLFPGLTLLALAGLALWRGRGARRWLWLGLGLVAFALSLGPTLTIRAGEPTAIALPYRWLWASVPGFDAIRAPVRWAVLVTLALAMLAALGLARLRWRWAAPLALALLLLEFAALPLRLVPAPAPFDALAWLDAQPPTTILELPLVAQRPGQAAPPDAPRLAWERSRLMEAQLFSTQHWHRTPDGYSGYVPARHGDFAREIHSFPAARSLTLLRGLGVAHVVVHLADLPAAQRREAEGAWPRAPGIAASRRIGDDLVLSLQSAAPAPLPTVALPLEQLPAGPTTLPLLLLSAPGQPYVPLASEPLALTLSWASGEQQQLFVPWPQLVDGVAILRLPINRPEGSWALTVAGRFPSGEPLVAQQQLRIAADVPATQLLALQAVEVERTGRTLRLAWQPLEPLTRYYSVALRLWDADGTLVASRDGPPDAETGTLAWLPGLRYGSTWHFDELPAGRNVSDYRLDVQWYDPETGHSVLLWQGDGFGSR